MSASPERIWAWSEDCGDVCVNEWSEAEGDHLGSYAENAELYILATPAALADSPEVAAIVAEAVANERERCLSLFDNTPRPLGDLWRHDGVRSKHDTCVHGVVMYEECVSCIAAAIRDPASGEAQEAAALRTGETR